MGSESRFVYTKSTIDIRRSKFLMNSFWKGAIYHGDLVPLEITRVMPGDSAKYDLSLFIRTATPPIAPFMDSVKLNVAAFYVPERLVSSKEKQFMGENTEGYGIQSEILMPRSTRSDMTVHTGEAVATYPRSIATYLGLVRQKTTELTKASPIALNPIRAYLQVYNDWFRNENFMNPYLWDHDQTGDDSRYIGTIGGSNVSGQTAVPKVCKNLDRFTSCLPWAQKGDPVLIGTSGLAPVVGVDLHGEADNVYLFGYDSYDELERKKFRIQTGEDDPENLTELADYTGILAQQIGANNPTITLNQADTTEHAVGRKFFADLSAATAASINQFRLAFATQRYLETLARTGSKYREVIKGLFGVSIGDTTAQMAEYLGGMSIELNVDQVLQTTDYAAGSSSKLGAPGASSTSAASQYLFTKSFNEPGFLVVVGYTKHQRTYGQGIDEIYKKHEILEEYNPKFANIGEQAIHKYNLYFTGEDADDDTRLGFQEAWSEYRYKKDVVIGALNPSISSSFNFWSLADNYASAPTLNADFLTEDRTNITRVLQGGESSPDYFLDIKFKRTFVRPMPLYSIPGLIDHH